MLYDCKTNNQSQKRYTMDSLKEETNPAPNPPKRSRIEVSEELMRQMIAGQAPLESKVNNGILNGLKHKTKHTSLRLQNEHSISKTSYHGFIKRKRQTFA